MLASGRVPDDQERKPSSTPKQQEHRSTCLVFPLSFLEEVFIGGATQNPLAFYHRFYFTDAKASPPHFKGYNFVACDPTTIQDSVSH
jgi:hypothetical protein